MHGEAYFAMTMLTAYLPMLVTSLLLPVIVYVVARWRLYREEQPADPYLGLKTLLAFFRTLAYQALLLGLFLAVNGLLDSGGDARETGVRAGLGVALPALLVHFAHAMALRFTNAAERPTVVRMFSGISLGLTGVVGFFSFVALGIALIGRGSLGATPWALALVYGVAWLLQGARFGASLGAPAPRAGAVEPAQP